MNDDILNRISVINVEDEMRESYLSYAMSVIASRALPDVRDGLKPVQRRILYAMREMGLTPEKQHRKCAGVIGEVLKSYHPHGDSSVYDALVRLAQDFTLRYPLVDGHGNFGSIDPDRAAAYRYTEARLARASNDVLADIDKDTVTFVPNFDNQGEEPTVLPGRLPQLIVNGTSGIAVGMATNIPPHNIGEVCDAIAELLDDENVSDERIAEIIKGPDFPTGGIIMGHEAIKTAYRTGRGSIIMRGKAEIVEEKGRYKIVITEIPFQVFRSRILIAVNEAVEEKRLVGVSGANDESNRKGTRIVIDIAKGATPNVVLNNLYKHTPLQSSFGFNMLALIPTNFVAFDRNASAETILASRPGMLEPQTLSMLDLLKYYVAHRREVVVRRADFDRKKAAERLHILHGFRIALDNIDRIIALIRSSDTTDEARQKMMAEFALTEIQANAIVDMRLRALTGLERRKIEDEIAKLEALVTDLLDILAKPVRQYQLIKAEVQDLKDRFGDPRRTEIIPLEGEFNVEDFIADTSVVITSTVGGYIKRVSVDTFRAQNRGGRGVVGIANLKKEDAVRNFFIATTHEYVLFFTNKGRAFRLRAYEIPDSTRTARGTALVNLLTLPPGEVVTANFPVRSFEDEGAFLLMVTKRGVIKKTPLGEFANIRKNGLLAVGLNDDDELLGVNLSNGERDVLLATHDGMAVHFSEKGVRSMGRAARGVKAITLATGDSVVAMDVVEDERKEVLIVTSRAYGKRTPIDDYRHTGRGGKGVKAFAKEKEIGYVVDQIMVKPEDELLLITSANQVIRIRVSDVRRAGRSTKGVLLQRLQDGDEVIAIANLGAQSAQVADITGEEPPAVE